MKRIFKKVSALLACTLATSMFIGMTVSAEGAQTDRIDFKHQYVNVAPGETGTNYFFASEPVKCFKLHSTSKKTTIAYTSSYGNSDVTIYVGADETSGTVQFVFYPMDGYDPIDSMFVNVKPDYSKKTKTSEKTPAQPVLEATSAPVLLADGTVGTMATKKDANVVLVTNGTDNDLGAFGITVKGKFIPVQVIGARDGYLYVAAPSAGKSKLAVSISAEDKANLVASGFAGVYVNNTKLDF